MKAYLKIQYKYIKMYQYIYCIILEKKERLKYHLIKKVKKE